MRLWPFFREMFTLEYAVWRLERSTQQYRRAEARLELARVRVLRDQARVRRELER